MLLIWIRTRFGVGSCVWGDRLQQSTLGGFIFAFRLSVRRFQLKHLLIRKCRFFGGRGCGFGMQLQLLRRDFAFPAATASIAFPAGTLIQQQFGRPTPSRFSGFSLFPDQSVGGRQILGFAFGMMWSAARIPGDAETPFPRPPRLYVRPQDLEVRSCGPEDARILPCAVNSAPFPLEEGSRKISSDCFVLSDEHGTNTSFGDLGESFLCVCRGPYSCRELERGRGWRWLFPSPLLGQRRQHGQFDRISRRCRSKSSHR